MHIPKIMTVAGSDSGGGAGIQADIKTIAALGGYGTTVITAITAQNTKAVTAIHEIPVNIVEAEFRAIMDDIGTDAIKIGMLSSDEIIKTIARLLDEYPVRHVVLDPVMISKSGAELLNPDAVDALMQDLIPRCSLITPNIPETEKLTGYKIATDEDIQNAALTLKQRGVRASLIKGGHLNRPDIVNTLFDCNEFYRFTTTRLATMYTHGTGCTLSSAIATYLGRNKPLGEAVELGIRYVSEGIKSGYRVGSGTNPLNHHFAVTGPQQ